MMNIPILNITATDSPPDTAAEDKKNYLLQIGILSSALEHAVPEQLFSADPTNPPDAISAVKALSKANTQGQRIYHITQANQGAALSNINHDQNIVDEIRNALNVGKEVITHTDAVSVPGWSGAGYIIFDPQTGDGAYKIGGGQNGGLLGGAVAFIGIAFLAAFAAPFTAIWALAAAISALIVGVLIGLAAVEIENQGGVTYTDVCLPVLRLAEMVVFLAFFPISTGTAAAVTSVLGAAGATAIGQLYDPVICTL